MPTSNALVDLTKGFLCASLTSATDLRSLTTEPCSGSRCTWFAAGSCGAVAETAEAFEKRYLPSGTQLPTCPIADQCRWNHDALKAGQRACPPRSLGLLCEHQANNENRNIAIWNTFDMADPDDDEAWSS